MIRTSTPRRVLGVAALGTLCTVGLVGLGQGSASAAATPSAQDKTFVTGNEQVNLAEITIGTIALQRASSQSVRDLATMTIADHKAAQTKLQAVAKTEGLTLPTAPNAAQQKQAATLKAVSADQFDLTYLQVQVAGHQLSIAATNSELSGGSDAVVTGYAKGYLPVAQKHLTMSQADLTQLGGTPTGAPAGTGGLAADRSRSVAPAVGLGLGGLALLAGSGVLVQRRRQASRSV